MAEANETQVSTTCLITSQGLIKPQNYRYSIHEYQGPATWSHVDKLQKALLMVSSLEMRWTVWAQGTTQGGTHIWEAIRFLPLGKGARHGKQELKNVLVLGFGQAETVP